MKQRVLGMALALSVGCAAEGPSAGAGARGEEREPVAGTEWIFEGDDHERLERVARHFRGFDVAMVEVGYRYTELHWAGHDHNWGYAGYQLEKIRTAIANGLERRPRRAPSAQRLEAPLAAVERAIAARDPSSFEREMGVLTAACNACHQDEQVPFVRIERPTERRSPVRGAAGE